MSMENVKRFMEEAEKNSGLQERMKTAAESCKKSAPQEMFEKMVLPLAQEMELAFTVEEYMDFLKGQMPREENGLSMDELDAVVGGIGGVDIDGTGGNVTVIDNSHIVNNGPDMSFMYYLIDKFY